MEEKYFIYLVIAAFCFVFIGDFSSATIVMVDPELRESVEDFIAKNQKLHQSDPGTAISPPPREKLPSTPKKKALCLDLLEDAMRLVYQELYENKSSSGRSLSAKQSFFSNGLAGLSEYLMSLVENSLEDLPSLPRLEAQECMKRSVCEAHNQPKKYGLIGLVLQLLFPPYTKTEDPNNVVSKYQLAARYGRQNNANCGVQYDGCMLNLLDVIQSLVNVFIR